MRYSFQDRPVSKFGPPIWNCDKSHFSQLPCIRRHNSVISQPITMKFGTHTGGAAGEVCHLWLPCSTCMSRIIANICLAVIWMSNYYSISEVLTISMFKQLHTHGTNSTPIIPISMHVIECDILLPYLQWTDTRYCMKLAIVVEFYYVIAHRMWSLCQWKVWAWRRIISTRLHLLNKTLTLQ